MGVRIPIVAAVVSDCQEGYAASGPADGDRLSASSASTWKGVAKSSAWQWTADFGSVQPVGAILQVLGDDESVLAAGSMDYVWQISADGVSWQDIPSTRIEGDRRLYRILRLPAPASGRYLRLNITHCSDGPPAIREIEAYRQTDAAIDFPAWFMVANSFDVRSVDTCDQFLNLARSCAGWKDVTAQFVWHGDLGGDFATAEPRPICLFFTGSFRDWCEVDPTTWTATANLLKDGSLPMWAACGGAQAFGILSDVGVLPKWDCPKCRDAAHPKSAIYGHIGAIDADKFEACGVYDNNLYERGPTPVRRVGDDPVFRGLPDEFVVPEFHCGQLEYLPSGWDLVATKGKGGKTWMQCMKKRDACIYAAQFHIELEGSPDASKLIMANFLAEAQQWSAGHGGRVVLANGTGTNAGSPGGAAAESIPLAKGSRAAE